MRAIRFFVSSIFILSALAVTAAAQTDSLKIGVINPALFGQDNGGITKYVNAIKSVDNEFKPDNEKLQALTNKINALRTEIETLQKQNATVPVKAEDVQKKAQEYDKLVRQFNFEKEDAEARLKAREQIVMGPVMQDIMTAMQEYANKNGFSMILDVSGLANAGLVFALDRKLDVTEDFIKFYNARPAGTATRSQ